MNLPGSPVPGDDLWRILDELAELKNRRGEEALRPILRPHEESSFSGIRDKEAIALRIRLDRALGALTRFEIDTQTGRSPAADPRTVELQKTGVKSLPWRESLRTLFRSEAFLHYCDTYLYFGIRFLAQRFLTAEEAARELTESRLPETAWRPFALMSPPVLKPDPDSAANFFAMINKDPSIEEPANQHPAKEELAALLFLDGYLNNIQDYELWLRGLLTTTDKNQIERFEAISSGLRSWIGRRIDFYITLTDPDSAEDYEKIDTKFKNLAAELGPAFSPSTVGDKSAYAQGRTRTLRGYYRPRGGWAMKDPAAGRFGLADIYWIARLLRATVSSAGMVSYEGTSWLHLLRFRANLDADTSAAEEIAQSEEILRSVFGYVCDLVQNAIAITGSCVREILAPDPISKNRVNKAWQHVFDEELNEIERQKELRNYRPPDEGPVSGKTPSGGAPPPKHPPDDRGWIGRVTHLVGLTLQKALRNYRPPDKGPVSGNTPSGGAPPPKHPPDDHGWSGRVRHGHTPRNLVGLAFSGGGIRSATFNLGVLQGLKELDILRHVDYLSTVSGGGFVGSWLVANVRRSVHWLGKVTDWRASIAHLRAYSSYLAPRTGILSSDTWTLVASWLRNTFFIQLTGLAWLFVLLLVPLIVKPVFVYLWIWKYGGFPLDNWLTYTSAFLIALTILYQLFRINADSEDTPVGQNSWLVGNLGASRSEWLRRLCIYPACVAAFLVSSLFWRDATVQSPKWVRLDSLIGFSSVLKSAWEPWRQILVFTLFALVLIALFSMRPPRRVHAFWMGPLCTAVVYLCLCAIFYVDRILVQSHRPEAAWAAYVITPAFVLFAYSLGVVLLIGFSGRASSEAFREWWTRVGAWLLAYPLAWIALAGVAVFGPQFASFAWTYLHNPALKWGSVIAWAGTVIGGLLAGKSSKTNGESDKSPKLEILAIVGGVLFLAGGAVLASTLLYLLLFKILGSDEACYLCFLTTLDHLRMVGKLSALGVVLFLGVLFSLCFEINIFGFSQFYRNRIVRCYLGATRTAPGLRRPNSLTGFDFNDDIKLHKLHRDKKLDALNGPFRGPFPIINCSLNLAGSKDLAVKNRHSASFSLTPLYCGSDRPLVGYVPTSQGGGRSFAGGIMLGQAVAVSGAAVSPNMGYNTSPLVAFLLTMFNVRLGWWFPNPSRRRWKRNGLDFSLYYLTRELFGLADERRLYLNVSDGGHFENLAVYELIRRRCKVIIACDSECDEDLHFGSLGNLIRICETDFGAYIKLDVRSIAHRNDGYSMSHCAVGEIQYSNGSLGYLIYIKASVTGDEPTSVLQYRSSHASFPHETTANQFFTEAQFDSYRALGQHVVEQAFRSAVTAQHPVVIAENLADILTPAGCASETFLRHSTALNAMWEKFRKSSALHPLLEELMGRSCRPVAESPTTCEEERCVVLELIQLMENVFLDLSLDDFWKHPDNRGWAILFMQWARSPRFRAIWNQSRRTFGIRFEHFCAARLGLERDDPAIRV